MSIIHVVTTKSDLAADFIEQLTGQRQTAPCSWHITTKYYDVDVHLKTTLHSEFPVTETDQIDEALILLVDHKDAFSTLTQWCQSQRREANTPISLLVCEGAIEEAVEWSIEYGFEYIRISLQDANRDAKLSTEEGQGMHRVVEAIQAHVWPGCALKGHTEAHPPSSIDTSSSPNEADGETTDDAFENLLLEMSNARDRLQNLPDEERRQGAANLAMQLAAYFVDDE